MTSSQVGSAAERIAQARHFLFVPGNRPDRFAKAVASGSDMVILDLEDAVPASEKDAARAAVRGWLDEGGEAMIRINAADTAWFDADSQLASHSGTIGLMLPKACDAIWLPQIAARTPVVALVETARGVEDMAAIARTPGVVRLALGTIDLALDLDMQAPDTAFDPVRLAMVVASRAAGIAAPVDGVTPDFKDADATQTAMRHGRSLGLRAKMCIHPAQLQAVQAALRPTDAELSWARRIVEADGASGGSAVALDGAMIDRPIVARAHRILRDGAPHA